MTQMNRVFRAIGALYVVVMTAAAGTAYAADEASSVTIGGVGTPIPAAAKKATLEASGGGELTLNGRPVRLSASAQIRGTNNLIVLSQSLRGAYPVRVLLDNAGQIQRAWIVGPAQ